jgi:uncharacterized protein YllA (UPF0747 family)
VTGPIEAASRAIAREYEALASAAEDIDPTLRDWILGRRNRALIDVVKTERKITAHLKKRRADEIRQIRRVSMNLHPDGAPQERVLNVVPFLARYGPGLLRDAARAMEAIIGDTTPDWRAEAGGAADVAGPDDA